MDAKEAKDQEQSFGLKKWAALVAPYIIVILAERLLWQTGITSRPLALAAAVLASGVLAVFLGFKRARSVSFWGWLCLLAIVIFIGSKLLL